MEDDFDEGLLSQLREEPPEELHSHMMKSIGREKKKRIFLNYRTYVPAIAAVFIFAIVLKGANGNYDINSIVKNKMAEKYETTDLAKLDNNNTSTSNNIINQEASKKEASDNTNNSETSKKATDGKNSIMTASTKKDTQPKDNKGSYSENRSGKSSIAYKDSKTTSSDKVSIDSFTAKKAGESSNTNTESNESIAQSGGANNKFISNPAPGILEQNKKLLGWMTEFNAVATEKNNTYKIAIYEFEKLQKKIIEEGLENKVLTELDRDGQCVTFRLNVE